MSAADPIELLSRVPLFSELSREDLERISRVAVPRSFPPGVRVFHEGDHSDACFVVRSGDLRAGVLNLKMAIAADPSSQFLRQALANLEDELKKP